MECVWHRGQRSEELYSSAEIEGGETRAEGSYTEEVVQAEEYQENDGRDGEAFCVARGTYGLF